MATPRRNGQLSSCEPCRKSKLRCDHAGPICGRCLKNGQGCVYHPAPLTQPRAPSCRVSRSRPKRHQRPESHVVFRLDPSISNGTTAARPPRPDSPEQSTMCDQPIAQSSVTSKGTLRSGLLGLPSAQNELGSFSENLDLQRDETGCPPTTHRLDADTDRISIGAGVLEHLQKISWFASIIELKSTKSSGWLLGPPLSTGMCKSVERMYDAAVHGSQDVHLSLLSLSRQMFVNASENVQTNAAMTLTEYMDSIAPRWETIGLVFVLVGTALFHIADDDAILTHRNPWNISKGELKRLCLRMGELCCQFGNSAQSVNDAFCWLQTQHLVLLSAISGDNDYKTWSKLGDLSTSVFALGLHQPNEHIQESVPFFLLEIRKRVMACAYAIDKQLATVLGQPPRICSRYCHLALPLDIPYDRICCASNGSHQLMHHLDENGWNTEGRLTVGVRIRVTLLTSLLQESVLELSLCPGLESIEERVADLIQQSHQTRETLPSFLRWSPNDKSAADECRLFAHVEFTYQEFLLHRILLKRLGTMTSGLIHSALEILTTLLEMMVVRTRSGNTLAYVAKDLCHMGLPAAGVLTLQLLPERSSAPDLPPAVQVNFRSMAIQKLSVFISHLTTLVDPEDALFDIAQQGAEFVREALHQTLSIPVPVAAVETRDFRSPGAWPRNSNSMDDPDFDFLAWCDEMSWPQDSLSGFY